VFTPVWKQFLARFASIICKCNFEQCSMLNHQLQWHSISTDLSRVEINFVANDDKWEVVRVTRTRLDKELISPAVQWTERVGWRHIIDQYTAVCTTVERYTEALEPLLTSCIPDLTNARQALIWLQEGYILWPNYSCDRQACWHWRYSQAMLHRHCSPSVSHNHSCVTNSSLYKDYNKQYPLQRL